MAEDCFVKCVHFTRMRCVL